MAADVRIRWHLELVGDAAREVLKQDRSIRSSLTATDRLQRKLATAATSRSREQVRGARGVATALQGEGRAARGTASDVQALNRAQATALSAGNRVASSARRVADAYRAQARGAHEATRAERARARAQQAGSRLTGAGARTVVGVGAVVATGGLAGAAVRTFAGFEQQMDRVQAVSGATGRQIAAMNAQAKRLGAETAFSAREAADGLYQLSTAGFTANQTMRILPGTLALASASGQDLASSAAIQAAAIRGFGLRAKDAGRVADVLAATVNRSATEMSDLGEMLPYVASTARVTGTSFEQVAAAAGILGNAGIKGSQAGTALRTSMLRLTDPSKKVLGILDGLGVNYKDLAAVPLPTAIGRLAGAMRGLPRAEKIGSISAIFGKEAAPSILNLFAKGERGINRMARELRGAKGAAKDTASVMRDNVAGAWDEFTGSVETGAITLTERWGPALKDALKDAAKLTNALAAGGGDFLKGLSGGADSGVRRGATSRTEGLGRAGAVEGPSRGQRLGADVANVARKVGSVAASAGRQLLDAFKPAMPFFRNVLLPLLKGIGQGVLVSVVGAFKVLTGIVRVVATGLGWLGEKAKPLRGVFQGIGTVIGFVFAGPILKGIGLLGKLGGVFKIVGAGAKLLAVPIRLLGALIGGAVRVVGSLAAKLAGPARKGFATIAVVASNAVATLRGVPGKMLAAAKSIVGAIGKGLAGVGRVITWPIRKGIELVPGIIRGFGGKVLDAGKWLVGRIGAGIRSAIGGLKGALSAVGNLVGAIGRSLADWLNDHTPFGNTIVNVDLPGPLPRVKISLPRLRRGGRLDGYADGGMIPAAVSPGELIEYGGRGVIVPGRPEPRDSVLAALPLGARVFTFDGQARLAAGASAEDALRTQAPHFATGGRVRRGLVGDAFSQGFGAGEEGRGRSGVLGAIRDALTGEPHRRKSKATAASAPSGLGTAPAAVLSMHQRAQQIAGRGLPYSYGGGHGGFGAGTPGFDCSGYVSAILGAGVLSSPMAVRQPMQSALAPGGGRFVSVGIRGTSGQNAHTMVRIGRSYFESGGGHGPAKVGGWNGSFDLFHPKGYRRGGFVAPGAGAGLVGATRGLVGAGRGKRAGAALERLDDVINSAVEGRLLALRRAAIAAVRHGGDRKLVKRLQATVSLIEGELGRRVGRLTQRVTARGDASSRQSGRTERFLRRRGIDSSSAQGLELSGMDAVFNIIPNARGQVASLAKALRKARRGGADRATLADLETRLADAKEGLSEALTSHVERMRELIRARAQERVDTAQYGVDLAQSAQTSQGTAQRLAGLMAGSPLAGALGGAIGSLGMTGAAAAGTPDALRQQAGQIMSTLVPSLQGQRGALEGQLAAAQQTGDVAGVRAATLALQANGNDLANALGDAAQALRDAATQAAQEAVDSASSQTNLAGAGLQRLELEQRLAGTYEAGGAARAQYITANVVPALQAELTALKEQERVAREQGDAAALRQTIEAEAAKSNEILQAQLDAQEQIADNTEPRRFGGTLGFGFGGETLTDTLVTTGNGL